MNAENWIAIIGLFLSAIIAYVTTKATINSEKRKGRKIILELIKKYLINFNSSWDTQTTTLKTDLVAKEQYLRVVEIIESEFKDLTNNPYYLDIIYKFPDLTMLQVYISREIAEIRNSETFALNKETLRYLFALYKIIKADLNGKHFREGGRFFEYDKLISEWEAMLKI